MLKGYKTYIIALLIVLLSGAKLQGYIDEATFQVLLATLGAGGMATMRHAVSTKTEGGER